MPADAEQLRLRVRLLEAELSRAYVSLADAAALCGMMDGQRAEEAAAGRQLQEAPLLATMGGAAGPGNDSLPCDCNRTDAGEGAFMPPFTEEWWTYTLTAIGCITVAALAAGLTMGMVGLDPFQLSVISHADPDDCLDPKLRAQLVEEKKAAEKVVCIAN